MRNNGRAAWTTVGVAVVMVALVLVSHVAAGMIGGRTTYLTFSRKVQLPGATLGAGAYVFEFADPFNAPGVVRVLSGDRKKAYFMGFTNAVERRPGVRLDASVSLGEAAAGVAPRITAWWPVGERTGREFIYSDR